MKKIIPFLIAFSLLLTTLSVCAFDDVGGDESFAGSIYKLCSLNILNGYPDGSFRPHETLTRAQFAKIAAIMQGEEETVVTSHVAGQFYDVAVDHWASSYIGFVAQKGIISGYSDGSFCPEKAISYGEAITIAVRMLGYSAEDVSYMWPDGYIDRALTLGIITSRGFDPYASISRGEAANILSNTLATDKKGSSNSLASNLDLNEYEDTVVVATQSVDPSLSGDMVSTTAGNFKKGKINMDEYVGKKVNLLVENKSNEIRHVEVQPQNENVAIVQKVIDKDFQVKIGGASTTIRIDDNVSVYYKGTKLSMANKRSTISEGSELHIFKTGDAIDYVFLYEYDNMGPITVTTNGNQLVDEFGIENTKTLNVVRDGYSSSLNKIEKNDIAYYNRGTNTIYVYVKKITGIYEEAYPLKANVLSAKVSGTTYEIEGSLAASKLGEAAGSYKIGDKVTLLMGADGRIADVVTLDSLDPADFCVILSTRTATSTNDADKGELIYYTKVITGDGYISELKSKKSYSMYEGEFMKINYAAGYAEFETTETNTIGGTIDRASLGIGTYLLAQNYTILERVKNPIGGEPEIRKIELSDINQNFISSADVIHAQFANEFNDILVLYVDNITNSNYSYGMLTKSSVNNMQLQISATYEVMVDGATSTYMLSGKSFSIYAGNPVGIIASGGQLDYMYALPCITSGGSIEKVASDRIKLKNGMIYKMSDDVQIFRRLSATEYTQLSVSELSQYSDRGISLYADRSVDNGGIVRVIVIK